MGIVGIRWLATSLVLFGAFSASSNYNLNSYSIGSGATNSSASATYKAQAALGESSTTGVNSSTKTGTSGGVQTEQLSVPLAPSLSNGSGAYYNKLQFILNDTAGSSNYPADATFAIAVSTDNFVTTTYVQSDGTLGSTPVYQTYTTWGGSGGSYMVNLSPNTTYKAKVAAKQGLFTNTAFGAAASASTVTPSITFSLSPNNLTLSNLLPGSVITSSNISYSLTTNAVSGGSIYVSGQNSGLHSTQNSFTISALTGNLASASHGFGLQGQSATQTSGGPLSIDSPYNGSANNVGAETTSYAQVFSAPAAITGGSATLNVQAKAATGDPSSTDYQEILSFVAAGSF